jgi:5-methyltetrahydrofolate--homocysteine methyltransferase
MALQNGLSAAIMNPGNEEMMESYRAYLALARLDPQCMGFIEAYAGTQDRVPAAKAAGAPGGTTGAADGTAGSAAAVGTGAGAASTDRTGGGAGRASAASSSAMGLTESVVRGMAQSAAEAARKALADTSALELINRDLIPALDHVGKGFEKGTVFLPQLLMSAEAAKAAFEVIKETLQGQTQKVKGRIILATVKGDIHDIGKNIVKVMLENYGYEVIDLGKDVAPETVVETAIRENIALVGLSALMTTTVVSMEETIRLLHEKKPDTKVVVGGAVMTQEYADAIHADCYAKDAMATVHFAEEVFGG